MGKREVTIFLNEIGMRDENERIRGPALVRSIRNFDFKTIKISFRQEVALWPLHERKGLNWSLPIYSANMLSNFETSYTI